MVFPADTGQHISVHAFPAYVLRTDIDISRKAGDRRLLAGYSAAVHVDRNPRGNNSIDVEIGDKETGYTGRVK